MQLKYCKYVIQVYIVIISLVSRTLLLKIVSSNVGIYNQFLIFLSYNKCLWRILFKTGLKCLTCYLQRQHKSFYCYYKMIASVVCHWHRYWHYDYCIIIIKCFMRTCAWSVLAHYPYVCCGISPWFYKYLSQIMEGNLKIVIFAPVTKKSFHLVFLFLSSKYAIYLLIFQYAHSLNYLKYEVFVITCWG